MSEPPERSGPSLMTGLAADKAYAAGWTLVKAMPAGVAATAFRFAGDMAFRRRGPGVRQLAVNLRRVVGSELPQENFDALLRAALRSYARYWREAFRLPVMDPTGIAAAVQRNTEGAENADRAYAAGRGVVFALPHSGNWDVGAVWLIHRGVPFTTVAERLRPESLYRRFLSFREGLGMEVVPLTGGERSPSDVLVDRLRSGGAVCLLADRDLTASGVEVDFFGARAKMPAGPALLAIRTGAALVPVHLWFEPDGWGQRLHPPVDIPSDGSLRERVQRTTQRLADVFAADIARRPQDWHMLQRLWLADLPHRPNTAEARAAEPRAADPEPATPAPVTPNSTPTGLGAVELGTASPVQAQPGPAPERIRPDRADPVEEPS